MATAARIRANAKYDKTHTVQVQLKLNKKTDDDIIAHLNALKNKQGYIKNLIREDIKKNYKKVIDKPI